MGYISGEQPQIGDIIRRDNEESRVVRVMKRELLNLDNQAVSTILAREASLVRRAIAGEAGAYASGEFPHLGDTVQRAGAGARKTSRVLEVRRDNIEVETVGAPSRRSVENTSKYTLVTRKTKTRRI